MRSIRFSLPDYAGAVGFLAYSSSTVITPICLLQLAKDLSFNLAEGGGIEAMRTSIILVVLILGGLAALKWGKSMVLAFGSLFLAAGLFGYALAPVYGVVLIAMVLIGLGDGLLEGLINPLVQDAHPDESGRYLNVVNSFWSIGVMSTVLITGELLTRGISWRHMVNGCGCLALGATVLFLCASRRDVRRHTTEATGAWREIRRIVAMKRFRMFAAALFCGGGAEGAFTFWSASYIQLELQGLPRAGGFGTACFSGGMIIGRLLSGHFVDQKRLRLLIIASAIVGMVVSSFIFVVNGTLGFYLLLALAGLSVACFWPSIQAYAADHLNADTTMVFILLSCAGIPGFGLVSWMMGIVAELFGLKVAFMVIPVFFLILIALIVWDYVLQRGSTATGSRPE